MEFATVSWDSRDVCRCPTGKNTLLTTMVLLCTIRSGTPLMHAYTGGYTKNYTNARSVTVNKTKVTLKKGKSFKIKARVIKLKKDRKLMPKSHAPALRYLSSNKKVASVTGGGKIRARAKGTCRIFVYAHNGVWKQIKVTVN